MFYSIKSKFLRKPEVTEETKMVLCKTTYFPVLSYGCVMRANHKTTKPTAVQCNELPEECGWENTEGQDGKQYHQNGPEHRTASGKNKYFQLRWFGHIQRMHEGRHPKHALEARSDGRRPQGRRRVVWADNILPLLKDRKCTWREAVIRAQDRAAWRTLCSTSTPQGRRGSD
jgi:hypothetical protein